MLRETTYTSHRTRLIVISPAGIPRMLAGNRTTVVKGDVGVVAVFTALSHTLGYADIVGGIFREDLSLAGRHTLDHDHFLDVCGNVDVETLNWLTFQDLLQGEQ